MKKNMFDSLKNIKTKYNQLQKELMKPKVLSDIKLYTQTIKKANHFKDIVESFESYLENQSNLEDAKILQFEKDIEIVKFAKSEINRIESLLILIEEELKILLLPKDKNDDKNVIIEIRGAAGGDEANIFAGDLYKMYTKWSDNNTMKTKIISSSQSNSGGFSQIIFIIIGENVYSKLKYESGVHRVQRIPSTETQGRVHTSTTTVTVMPEVDDNIEIEINNQDLRIDTFRSSGAGGQSVNTTDSAVRITHLPTSLVASSQDEKSQIQNKVSAMKVLKARIYDLELQKQKQAKSEFRKLAGTGARNEKIRTYNYSQDRVTDHRIGFSTSLKEIMDGKMNSIIEALLAEEKAEKIKEAGLK